MADDTIELEGWTLDELMSERGPVDTLGPLVDDEEIDWIGEDDEGDDVMDDEDDEEESELFGEIEQALLEDDEDPIFGVVSFGRVAMANRVRDAKQGALTKNEGYNEGYRRGVIDALQYAGVSERQAEEAYSGLFTAIGKGIFALGKHVVVPALSGASGLGQDANVSDLAYRAGSGVREGVSGDEDLDDPILGDGMQAPPVYVADDLGAHEGALAASAELGADLDNFDGLKGTSRFSAAVREDYGFIGRQPWSQAKRAADRALSAGREALVKSPAGDSVSMVRDPGANPVVYGSGRVVDEIHGALCAVPCPSCSHVQYGAMAKGAGKSCLVCDGYGAILVPEGDLPEYKGCVAYGAVFIPLLISAATSAAGSGAKKAGLFPDASKRFSEWKTEKTEDLQGWVAERRDGDDTSEAIFGLQRSCLVGAMVPESKLDAILESTEASELESFAELVDVADTLDDEVEDDYDDLEDLEDLEGQE